MAQLRDLPPELLDLVLADARRSPAAALRLAAVCRALRAAALGLPLWRRLDWRRATRRARSGAAVPALLASLQAWWGPRLLEFDSGGGGAHLTNELLTDAVLGRVVAAAPRLAELRLHGALHVTDEGLRAAAAACPPGLRELHLLWSGAGVSGAGVAALLAAAPRLEGLSVSADQFSRALGSIDDAWVERWLAPRAGALRRLELCDTRVGDAGLAALAAAAGGRLERLALDYSGGWTRRGVQAVADRCARLRSFSASKSGLDDAGLAALARAPALEDVDASYCAGVTLGGVAAAFEAGAALRRVDARRVWPHGMAPAQRAAFEARLAAAGVAWRPRPAVFVRTVPPALTGGPRRQQP